VVVINFAVYVAYGTLVFPNVKGPQTLIASIHSLNVTNKTQTSIPIGLVEMKEALVVFLVITIPGAKANFT